MGKVTFYAAKLKRFRLLPLKLLLFQEGLSHGVLALCYITLPMDSVSNLLRTIALSTCILTLVACEPNRGNADETQMQVVTANQSLDRMAAIEDELRARGLSIRNPNHAGYRISNANEAELSDFRQRLEEYVLHGQTALRISNRVDVSFRERLALEKRIVGVQVLLEKVKTRLRTITGLGSSDPAFWTRWNSCLTAQSQDLEIHGFYFLRYGEDDFRRMQSMGRRQRAEIAHRIRRYIECDGVLREGRRSLYGETSLYEKTSKSTLSTDKTAPSEIDALKQLLEKLPSDEPVLKK